MTKCVDCKGAGGHGAKLCKTCEGTGYAPNVFAPPSELKPCPFCGGEASNVSAGYAGPTNTWHAGDRIFAVDCKDCGASVPNRYRNCLVVEAWNKRVLP